VHAPAHFHHQKSKMNVYRNNLKFLERGDLHRRSESFTGGFMTAGPPQRAGREPLPETVPIEIPTMALIIRMKSNRF